MQEGKLEYIPKAHGRCSILAKLDADTASDKGNSRLYKKIMVREEELLQTAFEKLQGLGLHPGMEFGIISIKSISWSG